MPFVTRGLGFIQSHSHLHALVALDILKRSTLYLLRTAHWEILVWVIVPYCSLCSSEVQGLRCHVAVWVPYLRALLQVSTDHVRFEEVFYDVLGVLEEGLAVCINPSKSAQSLTREHMAISRWNLMSVVSRKLYIIIFIGPAWLHRRVLREIVRSTLKNIL